MVTLNYVQPSTASYEGHSSQPRNGFYLDDFLLSQPSLINPECIRTLILDFGLPLLGTGMPNGYIGDIITPGYDGQIRMQGATRMAESGDMLIGATVSNVPGRQGYIIKGTMQGTGQAASIFVKYSRVGDFLSSWHVITASKYNSVAEGLAKCVQGGPPSGGAAAENATVTIGQPKQLELFGSSAYMTEVLTGTALALLLMAGLFRKRVFARNR